MDRRGSVPLMAGGLMLTMVGALGLAVDTSRAWLVEARLKSAIDAAGLAAARRLTEPTRDAEATAVFWANITQGARPANYLGATITNPTFALEPNNPNRIRVSATATVPTTIFSVFGERNITRSESAVAQRSATGLELAIVLDASPSMLDPAAGGGTKLAAAQTAIGTMLNILYGAGNDLAENLYVSVVPFATNINIGSGNTAMLDTTNMPAGWQPSRWAGCVEARDTALAPMNDDAPTSGRRLRPYFWPSTFQQVGTVGSGRCTSANAYSGANNNSRFCHGDNDWLSGTTVRTHAQLVGNEMYDRLLTRGLGQISATTTQVAAGPNLLCMPTAVLPLTARRSAVQARVDSIVAPAASAGTIVSTGLEGAWYTLSPNWRGQWPETNTGVPNLRPLPVDYNTPNMRKAVVILTDGDNNWLEAQGPGSNALNWFGSGGCDTSNPGVCSSASGNELLYNAYGRARATGGWNTRFPAATISDANAVWPNSGATGPDGRLDARMSAACTAMKARGILIYVIGFEVQNSAHRTLLQNCSTRASDYYFESPSTAQLNTIFSEIASQLASLALTE